MREWYRRKWEWLRNSRWLALPEALIFGLLKFRVFLGMARRGKPRSNTVFGLYVVMLAVFTAYSFYQFSDYFLTASASAFLRNLFLAAVMLTLAVVAFILYAITRSSEKDPSRNLFFQATLWLLLLAGLLLYPVNTLLFLNLFLSIPENDLIVFLGTTLIQPILCPILVWFPYALTTYTNVSLPVVNEGQRAFLEFCIATSFIITALALYVGHIVTPQDYQPRNIQMFLSNVLFDGVTIVATTNILAYAVTTERRITIFTAIALDILVSAICAIFSLGFGLAFTEHQLSMREIWCVLNGLNSVGNRWEFGPYFFVMHTTFLPTIFFLALVQLGWICKVTIKCAVWFSHKGQDPILNPLQLTARFLGLLAASCGAVSGIIANY